MSGLILDQTYGDENNNKTLQKMPLPSCDQGLQTATYQLSKIDSNVQFHF